MFNLEKAHFILDEMVRLTIFLLVPVDRVHNLLTFGITGNEWLHSGDEQVECAPATSYDGEEHMILIFTTPNLMET